VVRNASTGISSLIAPSGEVMASAGVGKKSIITGKVGIMRGLTIYAKYGDWFAYFCAVIAVVGIFRAFITFGKMRGRQS
jgi:apolipoprotein N-acyltransferase